MVVLPEIHTTADEWSTNLLSYYLFLNKKHSGQLIQNRQATFIFFNISKYNYLPNVHYKTFDNHPALLLVVASYTQAMFLTLHLKNARLNSLIKICRSH